MTPKRLDLSDPATFAGAPPFAYFSHLRQTEPVHWADRPGQRGFWVVTRHSDVAALLRDKRLSAERGMTIDSVRMTRDPAAGVMLEVTDPPRHSVLRRIISRFFSRDSVKHMTPRLTDVVSDTFDRAERKARIDLSADMASPICAGVVGILTGADESDLDWIVERAGHAFEETSDIGRGQALRELFVYFGHVVGVRRGSDERRDDIVDALRFATGMDRQDVVANCVNVVAGAATIRNAITGCVVALLGSPEASHATTRDGTEPHLVTEELLRFASPALHVARTALTDIEISGRRIRAGEVVTLWFPAANRDEAVFRNPDVVVPDRDPNPHLSFAPGVHACLGSSIARAVLHLVIPMFAERFPAARQCEAASYLPSTFVSSIVSCPVDLFGEQAAGIGGSRRDGGPP